MSFGDSLNLNLTNFCIDQLINGVKFIANYIMKIFTDG